jgi:hypothetical protein
MLALKPGRIEVAYAGGFACVTLAGGLYTKSAISSGKCPEHAPDSVPLISETEDQGKAIVALQRWSSEVLADPVWAKLKTPLDVDLYVSMHLDTDAKGVKFDQPQPQRLRATYGKGSWCATFVGFETGPGIKLESCSNEMPSFSISPEQE